MPRGVRMPGADVFVLERFELLLGAEFVGLEDEISGRREGRWRDGAIAYHDGLQVADM